MSASTPTVLYPLRWIVLTGTWPQRVASDKTHCEPFDWVKTNQWVRTMPLWIVAIAIETMSNSNNKLGVKPSHDHHKNIEAQIKSNYNQQNPTEDEQNLTPHVF